MCWAQKSELLGRDTMFSACMLVRSSVRSSVWYRSYEQDIFKKNEPILMSTGTNGPRGNGMKRATLGVRRHFSLDIVSRTRFPRTFPPPGQFPLYFIWCMTFPVTTTTTMRQQFSKNSPPHGSVRARTRVVVRLGLGLEHHVVVRLGSEMRVSASFPLR